MTTVIPLNIKEYEEKAKEKLQKNAYDYYASGSNDMITLAENKSGLS